MFPDQLTAKVLILGGGNMGLAIAKGITGGNLSFLENLAIVEPDSTRREFLINNSFNCYSSIEDINFLPTIVFLAIKPQIFQEAAKCFNTIRKDPVIFASCMAGVSHASLCKHIKGSEDNCFPRVARFMPNLAATVGHSATGVYFGEILNLDERTLITQLLSTFSTIIPVENEDHIDIITAVAGSGPAYLAQLLKIMREVSIELGMNELSATELTLKTLHGLSQYFIFNPNISFSDLIKMVSSPGGTTESALAEMEAHGVPEGIKEGIKSAYKRSVELREVVN
jgi:pyrroline-5-carboxylate reductase